MIYYMKEASMSQTSPPLVSGPTDSRRWSACMWCGGNIPTKRRKRNRFYCGSCSQHAHSRITRAMKLFVRTDPTGYYVYACRDERGNITYVGKGCKDRWFHSHKERSAAQTDILVEGLTEDFAIALEKCLIGILRPVLNKRDFA